MKPWSVYVKRGRTVTGDRAVFVRDSFSVLAFIFPSIWFAIHRAWFGFFLYGLCALVTGMLVQVFELPVFAAVYASTIVSVLFALEAGEFHRRSLLRRGYHEEALVFADNRSEAEIRYFSKTSGETGRPLPWQESPTGGEERSVAPPSRPLGAVPTVTGFSFPEGRAP